MRVWSRIVFVLLLTLVVAGCPKEGGNSGAGGKAVVVSSIFPVHDLVRRVGGDAVQAELLLQPGQSAHNFSPSAKLAKTVSRAKAAFVVGLTLDGWATKTVEAAGSQIPIVKLGEQVKSETFKVDRLGAHAHAPEGPEPEKHGHDHGKDGDHDHGKDGHEHDKGAEHDHHKGADHDHGKDAVEHKAAGHAHKAGADHDDAHKHGKDADHHHHGESDEHHHHKAADHHHHEGAEHDKAGDDHGHKDGDHDHGKAGDDHDHGKAGDEHDHKDADHDHEHGKEGAHEKKPAEASKKAGEHDEHGHEGHHHAAGPDPHVWMSVTRTMAMVDIIEQELSKALPDKKAAFAANAKKLKAELEKLHKDITTKVKTFKNRRLVTFHGSFGYFAAEYGLDIVAVIEPFPGKQPSAAYLKEVLSALKGKDVAALYTEPQLDSRPAKVLADEAKLPLKQLDPLGGVDGRDSYEKLMRFNLAQLSESMG